MRAAFEYLNEPLCFNNDCVQVLVIENKQLFRYAIEELYTATENKMFVFSKDFKPLGNSDVCFVHDPLHPYFSDRKLTTKINALLTRFANERHMDELAELISRLVNLGTALCEDADFEVMSSYDFDAQSIVKFLSFGPRIDDMQTECERLIEFFKLFRTHLGVKLFVTANLHLYFSQYEIEKLFSAVRIYEIPLLVIENIAPAYSANNVRIIDEDLCDINNG